MTQKIKLDRCRKHDSSATPRVKRRTASHSISWFHLQITKPEESERDCKKIDIAD